MQKKVVAKTTPKKIKEADSEKLTPFIMLERELEAERELLRRIMDEVKEYAVYKVAMDGTIETWNKGAARLTCFKAADVIGKHFSMFLAADSITSHQEMTERALRLGRAESEGWRMRKNKPPILIHEIITPMYYADDSVRGFVIIMHNITEARRVKEITEQFSTDLEKSRSTLEREQAKDHALLRSIGEGVVATDEKGKIVLFNRQAEIMFGLKEADVLNEPFYTMIRLEEESGQLVPIRERPITLALQEGREILDASHYYVTPYIKRFPATIVASPVILNKKIVGVVSVIRNITKEKEVDRAKSEFVSLVSHQLRTPLTAIKLFVEMLETNGLGEITEDQREVIGNIGESNEKMIELVDNLLNVSRMESGRLKIEYKRLNLVTFIRSIADEARPLAESRKCELLFKFPRTPNVEIYTDPVLMRQVLINLITNALYYSPPRTPVTISLVRKSRDKYSMTVEDEGMGIPKEEQSKIFERFYRADNAIKAKTEGNGLGLYMCKIILKAMGGEISVDSEPGKGTAFHITIPRDQRNTRSKPGLQK